MKDTYSALVKRRDTGKTLQIICIADCLQTVTDLCKARFWECDVMKINALNSTDTNHIVAVFPID